MGWQWLTLDLLGYYLTAYANRTVTIPRVNQNDCQKWFRGMISGSRSRRWLAMAWAMYAETIGAKNRFAIRIAGCVIQVRLRNSMEMSANPQPIMNHAIHFPVNDSGQSTGKSHSIGEYPIISMINSKMP